MQGGARKFVADEFDEKAIFLCQFCGGRECKQEDFRTNTKLPNAIEGLHSNWITDDILAMQRPSQRLIKEYNLYARFKEKGIKAVLNLQQPGEHPYCGDGIIPNVGFSYIPQNFYQHGIQCFSQCWEDMTSTTFEHMMRIMNIFEQSLRNGGRISVHCHAGLGRTLLVICSWLIYHDRMTAQQTIDLAIEKRKGVLSSSSQRVFLKHFEEQLSIRWISYGIDPLHRSFTEFVDWQTLSLLNKEKKRIYSTPVAHFRIMRELRKQEKQNSSAVLEAFLASNSSYFSGKWDQNSEAKLQKLKKQINLINFKGLKQIKDTRILSELLFDFYQSLPCTLLTAISVDCLKEQAQKLQQSRLKTLLFPAVVHSFGVSTMAVILDMVYFAKELLSSSQKNKKPTQKEQESKVEEKQLSQQRSKIESGIQEALFIRLALLLLSKKKFFQQLFGGTNLRQCKILKLGKKVKKVVGPQVLFLSEYLLQLGKQLPEQWQKIEEIIFKTKKVESNLFFLLKESEQKKSLSGFQKQKLYEGASLGHHTI